MCDQFTDGTLVCGLSMKTKILSTGPKIGFSSNVVFSLVTNIKISPRNILKFMK